MKESKFKKFLGSTVLVCTHTHKRMASDGITDYIESHKYNCIVVEEKKARTFFREYNSDRNTKIVIKIQTEYGNYISVSDEFDDTNYLLNNFYTLAEHRKLMISKLL